MDHTGIPPAPSPKTPIPARRAGGKRPTKHPLRRLISKLAFVAGLIAPVAFPVLAQDGTGPMPSNAQARSYGSGWSAILATG